MFFLLSFSFISSECRSCYPDYLSDRRYPRADLTVKTGRVGLACAFRESCCTIIAGIGANFKAFAHSMAAILTSKTGSHLESRSPFLGEGSAVFITESTMIVAIPESWRSPLIHLPIAWHVLDACTALGSPEQPPGAKVVVLSATIT